MKLFGTVAVVIGLTIGASACGEIEEYQDAPIGDRNTGSADIMDFPDGFSNVAAKCDGTTRVYSSTNGGNSTGRALAVSPNDPKCANG